jgi:cytoskeletal protein CcmA (bactofilin family)
MGTGWFGRKRHDSGEWTGFLEQGVKLEGRLESSGTFRIDSIVRGNLVSYETLILGEKSDVEGQIDGRYVIVGGHFDGIIKASVKVQIQSKAIVTGEIHTPCLVMEPGAIFDGRCHMLSSSEAAAPITIPIRSAAAHA